MTNHVDKGILEIKYNDLNLPSYVKFNHFVARFGGDVYRNVSYSYRADGVKIKKVHHYFSGRKQNDAFANTDYIDGFQYGNDQSGLAGPTILQFFATSEGYFDYQNNRYIYHYTDHLGNVRVSFTREGSEAVIVEKNDYYAFGLKHGNTFDNSGANYNYEYNGKEMQEEIGMYDYGARFYMPDLGRWGVVDPLAEMNTRFSPYHYAANNPMRFIDPDGRNAMDTMMKLGGTWQNVGYGYFNAELGKYIDYEGNEMNAAQVLESRAIISGGGGAGSGSFIDIYFENSGSAVGLLSMIQQLKNAGWNDPINTKAKFSDIYALLENIPSLKIMYKKFTKERSVMFQDFGTEFPGRYLQGTNRIAFNMKEITNILQFAFTAGHEMLHLYDAYYINRDLREYFGITTIGTAAISLYGEYRSYTWMNNLGYQDSKGNSIHVLRVVKHYSQQLDEETKSSIGTRAYEMMLQNLNILNNKYKIP